MTSDAASIAFLAATARDLLAAVKARAGLDGRARHLRPAAIARLASGVRVLASFLRRLLLLMALTFEHGLIDRVDAGKPLPRPDGHKSAPSLRFKVLEPPFKMSVLAAGAELPVSWLDRVKKAAFDPHNRQIDAAKQSPSPWWGGVGVGGSLGQGHCFRLLHQPDQPPIPRPLPHEGEGERFGRFCGTLTGTKPTRPIQSPARLYRMLDLLAAIAANPEPRARRLAFHLARRRPGAIPPPAGPQRLAGHWGTEIRANHDAMAEAIRQAARVRPPPLPPPRRAGPMVTGF